MPDYPPEAYAPDGTLWWLLETWPGKKLQFGAEGRLAAWLTFNAPPGSTLTMRQLRDVLGEEDQPNAQEHFNRRFRTLRSFGYELLSQRDDGELRPNEYRVNALGAPIWLGKAQFAPSRPSARIRRAVFDRDGYRCVVCGIGSGEEYADQSGVKARLTLGHVVPHALHGEADANNLRTECARCNEPVREEAATTETIEVLLPRLRSLKQGEKRKILDWMIAGRRSRDEVDVLYDQLRVLPPGQRDEVIEALRLATRRTE